MSKKLLVLGIGHAQVDLIHAAKEMGFEVVACAFNEEGPGRALVDDFKQLDIKDVEAVKQYAKEQEVDFIYSMALELSVPTMAAVSEELDLPTFVKPASLEKIENKAVWRTELGDVEGNIKHLSGTKVEDFESWDIYPAILKPVDGSGQRGVVRVDSFEDIQVAFEESVSHSLSEELMVEEFVDGPEISVNSFVENGELKFALVSDRISYDEYPGGIIKAHYIPSRIIDEEAKDIVINLVDKVNKAIGFQNGHIYFQMKVQNNKPYLIEFTPRFDACHMWNLIYYSTGLDLRKVALETLAYGESETLANFDEGQDITEVETHFISDKPGTIVNKENYEIPENPLYLKWYYDDGQKVRSVTGYMEKVGYYIVERK